MIATRFDRAPEGSDMSIHLSPEATSALAEELATLPDLAELREILVKQLKEEPEDEGQRVNRHHRDTVRRSRNLSFQR
jgi:tRNA U34 5-methylaminomethyl-2-thiouridine-forming methyltransferase MnmC